MCRTLGGPKLFPDGIIGRRVAVVASYVAKQAAEFLKCGGVERALLLDTVSRPGSEVVEAPTGLATPITGTSSWPRFTKACKAGNIFLYSRSPVAPKMTRASESDSVIRIFPHFRDKRTRYLQPAGHKDNRATFLTRQEELSTNPSGR